MRYGIFSGRVDPRVGSPRRQPQRRTDALMTLGFFDLAARQPLIVVSRGKAIAKCREFSRYYSLQIRFYLRQVTMRTKRIPVEAYSPPARVDSFSPSR